MDVNCPNKYTFISRATILNVVRTSFGHEILVEYQRDRRPRSEQVILIVSDSTIIQDESGNDISARKLRPDMLINAFISCAMTRSMPPKAQAYRIQLVSMANIEVTTVGRVLERSSFPPSFLLLSGPRPVSTIRFNVSPETRFFNVRGRRISFEDLRVGQRVSVTHSPAMTASIPPQTTAFTVRILN